MSLELPPQETRKSMLKKALSLFLIMAGAAPVVENDDADSRFVLAVKALGENRAVALASACSICVGAVMGKEAADITLNELETYVTHAARGIPFSSLF